MNTDNNRIDYNTLMRDIEENYKQGREIYRFIDLRTFLRIFKDGNKMYNESTIFRNAVNSLYYGQNPFDVIQSLCESVDRISSELSEHLQKCPRPKQIFLENFDGDINIS